MTDAAGQITATPVLPIVRVAVVAGDRAADVALPVELPLREILPAILELLPPNTDAMDTVGQYASNRLSLAPIGGAPFSLDATLETVGVTDGDLLLLQPVPAGPAAPGVVEDVADAAVIFSQSRSRRWEAAQISLLARVTLVTLLLAATGLAVAHHASTGAAIGVYALSVLAALGMIGTLALQSGSKRTAAELSIATAVPLAAALALVVPGDLGAAHVVLAAAGVTAWALICLILSVPRRAVFTAAAVVGAAVLVAGAVGEIWPLSLRTLGCGLVTASLLITVQAAQLSAVLARLPLPAIPAPGDPAPPAPALQVLQDLPRRVRISGDYQTGLIAASVVLSVLGSVALAARPESLVAWTWYVIIATTAASLIRARVWDTAACKAWLLAQPVLLAICLLVLFSATGRYSAALAVLGVLAALTAGFVAAAISPDLARPESYSLPIRRALGFLASALDASLIPVMAYLVGLFDWILSR